MEEEEEEEVQVHRVEVGRDVVEGRGRVVVEVVVVVREQSAASAVIIAPATVRVHHPLLIRA